MQKVKGISIILGLILLVILALYMYLVMGNQLRASRGEKKVADYVGTMYADYQSRGVSCQGEDSDNNGYITCNVRIEKMIEATSTGNTAGVEKTLSLQCPTFWKSFMATSCKEAGMIINTQ